MEQFKIEQYHQHLITVMITVLSITFTITLNDPFYQPSQKISIHSDKFTVQDM